MYSGILTRGDTFNTIYLDPPIAREITMAGEMLGCGTMGSNVYWLNLAALAEIGAINDDQGNADVGFKTSALPITYDGGYLQQEADHLLVNDTHLFRYAPLGALEVLSDTNFKFGSMDINVAVLDFISTCAISFSELSTTTVTPIFTKGTKVVIFNETTQTQLGEVGTSGTQLTFSAQTVGNVISAYAVDISYNRSAKKAQTIA